MGSLPVRRSEIGSGLSASLVLVTLPGAAARLPFGRHMVRTAIGSRLGVILKVRQSRVVPGEFQMPPFRGYVLRKWTSATRPGPDQEPAPFARLLDAKGVGRPTILRSLLPETGRRTNQRHDLGQACRRLMRTG